MHLFFLFSPSLPPTHPNSNHLIFLSKMLSSTVLIGHILWLKHDSATIQGFSEEKEAIYTHPILLLTEKDSNGYVKALSV